MFATYGSVGIDGSIDIIILLLFGYVVGEDMNRTYNVSNWV